MQYKIEAVDEEVFVPVSVTLILETKAEHRWFHDKVACRISRSGKFIKDAFLCGNEGVSAGMFGDVPLREDFGE